MNQNQYPELDALSPYVQQMRRYAQWKQLADQYQQQTRNLPITSTGQGIAQIVTQGLAGFLGGYEQGQANKAGQDVLAARQQAFQQAYPQPSGGGDQAANPNDRLGQVITDAQNAPPPQQPPPSYNEAQLMSSNPQVQWEGQQNALASQAQIADALQKSYFQQQNDAAKAAAQGAQARQTRAFEQGLPMTPAQQAADERARQEIGIRGQELAQRQYQFGNLSEEQKQALARRDQELALRQAQLQYEQQGTVPSGYRRTEQGLEAVPGGPADLEVIKAQNELKQRDAISGQQSKDLTELDQQAATIKGALNAVSANPDAFGGGKAVALGAAKGLGEAAGSVAERALYSPDQIQSRSMLMNQVSSVIKERAGTAQTQAEMKRITAFLPSEYDSVPQIQAKLNGFMDYLGERRQGITPYQAGSTTPRAGQAPYSAPSTPSRAPAVRFQDMIKKYQ